MRGNALAIKDEQVDFRRQGQEGGRQQPVKICGAFENAPHGKPRQQFEGEHLPGMFERAPQQCGDKGHGRQQGIGQQQEHSGGAKQGAHKGGQRKMSAIINPFVILRSYKYGLAQCLQAGKNIKYLMILAGSGLVVIIQN